MSDVKDVSEEVLIQSIREIVESADLNVMTSKLVRNELKTKLNVENLDSRKKQINSIINDVIIDLSKRNNKKNKNKDNNEDIKPEVKSESNAVKCESEESPNDKSTKDKVPDNESEDSSSDDDNQDLSDEGLARKLHNQELDSKRRVTRNIRTTKKKSSTKKTNKRKNKDNSEDSDGKEPKKRKNGYLKPCVLSTDLAEFLGEPEMARHEVVKRIWSYVKEKNLLDPKNKQFAICDNPLIKIFGRKRVRMFGMMKILAKHLN